MFSGQKFCRAIITNVETTNEIAKAIVVLYNFFKNRTENHFDIIENEYAGSNGELENLGQVISRIHCFRDLIRKIHECYQDMQKFHPRDASDYSELKTNQLKKFSNVFSTI